MLRRKSDLRGVRNAYSKPPAVREAFLIHLRYNFHNPPLTQRDYTAIEHQVGAELISLIPATSL